MQAGERLGQRTCGYGLLLPHLPRIHEWGKGAASIAD
jgi:hypothetical protein